MNKNSTTDLDLDDLLRAFGRVYKLRFVRSLYRMHGLVDSFLNFLYDVRGNRVEAEYLPLVLCERKASQRHSMRKKKTSLVVTINEPPGDKECSKNHVTHCQSTPGSK